MFTTDKKTILEAVAIAALTCLVTKTIEFVFKKLDKSEKEDKDKKVCGKV